VGANDVLIHASIKKLLLLLLLPAQMMMCRCQRITHPYRSVCNLKPGK
jgi:hypothetical protein